VEYRAGWFLSFVPDTALGILGTWARSSWRWLPARNQTCCGDHTINTAILERGTICRPSQARVFPNHLVRFPINNNVIFNRGRRRNHLPHIQDMETNRRKQFGSNTVAKIGGVRGQHGTHCPSKYGVEICQQTPASGSNGSIGF